MSVSDLSVLRVLRSWIIPMYLLRLHNCCLQVLGNKALKLKLQCQYTNKALKLTLECHHNTYVANRMLLWLSLVNYLTKK
jgi:hypothetical protein